MFPPQPSIHRPGVNCQDQTWDLTAPVHNFLRLTAWASPRAFASKTRPDGHAVKQVVCENLCVGAYLTRS